MSHTLSIFRVFSSQLIRARLLFVALGGVLLFSSMAHASLIPSLVSGPINLGNGTFQYNYRVTLSSDERIDPAATNGVSCPGPSNSNTQCDPAGTFVTLYDVPGLLAVNFTADASTPAGGTFTPSTQIFGPTPNSINGAAFDSNALVNASFTYSGPVVNGPAVFTGFSLITQFSGTNPLGNFTSQSTNNSASSTSGTSDQVIGSVPIPVGRTAASVNVGGRITTNFGRGVGGIRVTLTGLDGGEPKIVFSDKSGYYSFPGVEVGGTYTVMASGKRYAFAQNTRLHTVTDEVTDIDFTAFAFGR